MKRNIALIGILVVIVAVMFGYIVYNNYGFDVMGRTEVATTKDVFLYDADVYRADAGKQNALVVGNGKLVAFDMKGETQYTLQCRMLRPVLRSSGNYALLYDDTGRELVNYRGETASAQLTMSDDILYADVTDDGIVTVVTRATGYRSMVGVYDNVGNPLYTWRIAEDYCISANADKRSNSVAASVISISDEGRSNGLRIMDMKDDGVASHIPTDGVALNIAYLNGNAVGICENEVLCVNKAGEVQWRYAYQGSTLIDYAYDKETVVLLLSGLRGGTHVVSLSRSGSTLGEYESQTPLDCVTVGSGTVAVADDNSVFVMSRALKVSDIYDVPYAPKRLRIVSGGIAVLHAEGILAIKR